MVSCPREAYRRETINRKGPPVICLIWIHSRDTPVLVETVLVSGRGIRDGASRRTPSTRNIQRILLPAVRLETFLPDITWKEGPLAPHSPPGERPE